jgi:uncharacterized protein
MLWVGLINRLHALAWTEKLINWLTAISFGILFFGPVALVGYLVATGKIFSVEAIWADLPVWLDGYLWFCCLFFIFGSIIWLVRHFFYRLPSSILPQSDLVELHDLRVCGGKRRESHPICHLPGNQILKLETSEWTLRLPGVPKSLDGFSILHLSDLHFTRRVGRDYYESVVDICNRQEADIVVLTGDLLDDRTCLDWLESTLGRLRSRWGTYFVLGNHDVRYLSGGLRQRLVDLGLVDLGGKSFRLKTPGGTILLAGSEQPWIGSEPELDEPESDPAAIRLFLSHSPDQWPFAAKKHFDLMLSGHLHGGQIRFPMVGPIFSPSLGGVRWTRRTWYSRAKKGLSESTVLCVSRGVSATVPVRFNCPPEVIKLVLRAD